MAAASDIFGVLFPVAGIEGLEAPGSGVPPILERGEQGLEVDDPFAGKDPVFILDLPRRLIGRVIQVYQREPLDGKGVQWLTATRMPVTGVENEGDAIDAVNGLGRSGCPAGRLDRGPARGHRASPGRPDGFRVPALAAGLPAGRARGAPGRSAAGVSSHPR